MFNTSQFSTTGVKHCTMNLNKQYDSIQAIMQYKCVQYKRPVCCDEKQGMISNYKFHEPSGRGF